MREVKDILITGSNGTIGTVLRNNLRHNITPFDLPEHDVRDYEDLLAHASGQDAIVHLGWDTVTDNYTSDHMNPDNLLMSDNVYKAAVKAGVGRVIMASSVNADRFTDRDIEGLLDPYALPIPNSPYGAGKAHMEALGRYYATFKNLGVVCIRFGAVNPDNMPAEPGEDRERQVWFSHKDCGRLVDASVSVPEIPDNYQIIYGVSDNPGRIHDVRNGIGWQPLNGAPLVSEGAGQK
jgi:uronate dehydrogenase